MSRNIKPKPKKRAASSQESSDEKDANKKRILSSYNKKKFLAALKSTNCNPDDEKVVFGTLRDDSKIAVGKGKHGSTFLQ